MVDLAWGFYLLASAPCGFFLPSPGPESLSSCSVQVLLTLVSLLGAL
jgi:hypothetical protein